MGNRLTQGRLSNRHTMSTQTYGWTFDGSAANRLRDKSAIGRPMGEGTLLLAPAEVLFCHHYRNTPLPSPDWLDSVLDNMPSLLFEYSVLEALRVPGNKVVLHSNFDVFNVECDVESWGVRWSSDQKPNTSAPTSEIRWFHSSDLLNHSQLLEWANRVSGKNRIAEVLIVDDEFSVVTYRVKEVNPNGDIPCNNLLGELANIKGGVDVDGGRIYPAENWPHSQIGIPIEGGIFVDSNFCTIIDDKSMDEGASVLVDLLMRGLHPRPGFKYGTEWRCYDKIIGEDHAPFLVTLPSKVPSDWGGACLASRLASGVNKTWLIPVENGPNWKYLTVIRPPNDARWSSPNRR